MADPRPAAAPPVPASGAIIPALDGVRGLAILLVLAHNLSPFEGGERWIDHWAGLASTFGWVGVQLFFVLSGYLISGILLDTRGAPGYYRGFFGRRVLRIFPLYYGFLVVCLIVLPALGLAPDRLLEDRDHRIWLWTYLINWAEPLGAGVAAFPHFWSLAVEEQFYLVWPFVVRRTTPRRLLVVAVVVAVIAFGSRLGLRLAGASSQGPYMFTICRMDALGLGGAVAAVMRIPAYRAAAARWRGAITAGAGALFVAGLLATRGYPRTGFRDQTFGYTILAVSCAVLVLLAVLDHERGHGWVGGVCKNAVLRSFGKYSYAIYLLHQPLNQMVGMPWLVALHPRGIGLKAGSAYMIGVTAVSYAIAFVSYHGYEKHFLALKRYFPAGRPPSAANAA
ncbi:MAG TPA: acyltransferase [Kofleriaceae bacterium]|nr:acyltransferase [Kofleriaceae bacterium]